jgi:hypothetical protein
MFSELSLQYLKTGFWLCLSSASADEGLWQALLNLFEESHSE